MPCSVSPNDDLDLNIDILCEKLTGNITNLALDLKKHLLYTMPQEFGVSCKACLGDKYFDILIIRFFQICLVLGQILREIKLYNVFFCGLRDRCGISLVWCVKNSLENRFSCGKWGQEESMYVVLLNLWDLEEE